MPHDRFFGIAAQELADASFDRDLCARCYATALGDAEKTKALYIAIRAERLEELALEMAKAARENLEAARARAELEAKEKSRQDRERDKAARRSQEEAIRIKNAEEDRRMWRSTETKPPLSKGVQFSDPSVQTAVDAMREALRASGWKNRSD